MKKDIARKESYVVFIPKVLTFCSSLVEKNKKKMNKMAYFRNLKKYFYSFLLTSYFPVDLNFFQINF